MTHPMNEKDVDALLPFFVNGTLEGSEHAAVEDAIKSDANLDAQANALASVRQTIKRVDDETRSPGEQGLKRLLADIDKIEAAVPKQATAANTNAAPLWQRLGGYAAAACIGALTVFVTVQYSDQVDFAVQASGQVGLDAPEMTMSVLFSEGAALADIAAILRSEGLVIVDGPSARGLFRLADLDGGALTSGQADKLRSRSAIFATVDDPM